MYGRDHTVPTLNRDKSRLMTYRITIYLLLNIFSCKFSNILKSTDPTTTESNTVSSLYVLSTGVVPAPVMLKLGNSTIDSTKSFKVPQPTSDITDSGRTITNQPKLILDMVPHVVSAKNTYFDHDRKYGPNFEDTPKGNVTKITVQLGEDAYLNCRISLLQDKTVRNIHY